MANEKEAPPTPPRTVVGHSEFTPDQVDDIQQVVQECFEAWSKGQRELLIENWPEIEAEIANRISINRILKGTVTPPKNKIGSWFVCLFWVLMGLALFSLLVGACFDKGEKNGGK